MVESNLFKEGKTLELNLDLDQLAKETLELSSSSSQYMIEEERARSRFWALDVVEDSCPILEDVLNDDSLPFAPAGPGLVFKVEKGVSTFCIRGLATENIEQTLLDVESGEVKTREKLRIQDEFDYDNLNFFETGELSMAQVLMDQLFNRRFPVDEDVLCNLSDPGFSWWLDHDEKGMEIYFKSHGLDRMARFNRLGPIGDNAVACLRLNQASSFIRSIFPVNEFSCDDKSLKLIPVDTQNENYQKFLSLFLDGGRFFDIQDFPEERGGRTLYFYLKELSTLRSFWVNLEEILEDLN